jgi:hypothetical protein
MIQEIASNAGDEQNAPTRFEEGSVFTHSNLCAQRCFRPNVLRIKNRGFNESYFVMV